MKGSLFSRFAFKSKAEDASGPMSNKNKAIKVETQSKRMMKRELKPETKRLKRSEDNFCLWTNSQRNPTTCLKSSRFPEHTSGAKSSNLENRYRKADSATRLAELELIMDYRKNKTATVDAFHTFLLSLGGQHRAKAERNIKSIPSCADTQARISVPGSHGRYWALIACLLSVQCRDMVALQAIQALIKQCPRGPEDVANLSDEMLEAACRRCNFYKTKAKNIKKSTMTLLSKYGGLPPTQYDQLLKLHGVGPKIANLLRSVAFGGNYWRINIE